MYPIPEAAAAEGYNTIIPAYYEDALKNKYIRDEKSVEIINMLSDYPLCNFGAQYYNVGFYNFLREFKAENIASKIAAYGKQIQKKLDSLKEALEAGD